MRVLRLYTRDSASGSAPIRPANAAAAASAAHSGRTKGESHLPMECHLSLISLKYKEPLMIQGQYDPPSGQQFVLMSHRGKPLLQRHPVLVPVTLLSSS